MKLPAPQSLSMLLCLCGPILAQTQNTPKIIDAIEIRGARNIPPETLKALIGAKPGDVFNREALARDFNTLWQTGSFSISNSRPNRARMAGSQSASSSPIVKINGYQP
jgi:outer membrane protein assembly factor BamA